MTSATKPRIQNKPNETRKVETKPPLPKLVVLIKKPTLMITTIAKIFNNMDSPQGHLAPLVNRNHKKRANCPFLR